MSRNLAEQLRPYIMEMIDAAIGEVDGETGAPSETPWEILSGIGLVDNKTGKKHRLFLYDGSLYIELADMDSQPLVPISPVKPPDNGINPPIDNIKTIGGITALPEI